MDFPNKQPRKRAATVGGARPDDLASSEPGPSLNRLVFKHNVGELSRSGSRSRMRPTDDEEDRNSAVEPLALEQARVEVERRRTDSLKKGVSALHVAMGLRRPVGEEHGVVVKLSEPELVEAENQIRELVEHERRTRRSASQPRSKTAKRRRGQTISAAPTKPLALDHSPQKGRKPKIELDSHGRPVIIADCFEELPSDDRKIISQCAISQLSLSDPVNFSIMLRALHFCQKKRYKMTKPISPREWSRRERRRHPDHNKKSASAGAARSTSGGSTPTPTTPTTPTTTSRLQSNNSDILTPMGERDESPYGRGSRSRSRTHTQSRSRTGRGGSDRVRPRRASVGDANDITVPLSPAAARLLSTNAPTGNRVRGRSNTVGGTAPSPMGQTPLADDDNNNNNNNNNDDDDNNNNNKKDEQAKEKGPQDAAGSASVSTKATSVRKDHTEGLEIDFRADDPRKIFTNLNRIGSGGYGKVYSAIMKTENGPEKVAIKKLDHVSAREKYANLMEICTLRDLPHPNIVSYVGTYKHKEEVWLCMEHMEGGTIHDAIQTRQFNEPEIAFIAAEILQGLAFLHGKNIIHRDLKTNNIMMTIDGRCKLIDFGLVKHLNPGRAGDGRRMLGTSFYMAPEMIRNEPYTFGVDIWAFGIVMMELANRHLPNRKHKLKAMYIAATEGYPDPLQDTKKWSDNFGDFVASIMTPNHRIRPTAEQLLQHPFLEKRSTIEEIRNIVQMVFLNNAVGMLGT